MQQQIVRLVAVGLLIFSVPVHVIGDSEEQDFTARIDQLLKKAWKENSIEPADPSTDAEFLRRAWLDLCGIIPPINDPDGISGINGFLADTRPNKRELLVQRLLARPNHATHFANIWKNVMLPQEVNVVRFGGDNGFKTWLRTQFADNRPYNEMVTELLVATGNANQASPALFYTALQLKPEELAASTSKIFLGTQIQCAQCHDHPFDHWKRKDFWGYAAFFGRLQRGARNQQVAFQVNDVATGDVKIPETDEIVKPAFLGGKASPDEGELNRRQRLAAWMTSGENPWFAKATVNRVWALLFGRGIVDPVDDLGSHNPPVYPELLDELAAHFVETGFDLNGLIRTLTRTQAYQLSSRSSEGQPEEPELFSRMSIKSLTADQLYDCLAEAMRRREQSVGNQQVFVGGGRFDAARQNFLAKFRAPTQGATEYEAGIPQALTLMNGTAVRQATDIAQSDLLVALSAPFFNNERRVEVLFLSTLSRKPTDEERARFVEYVENGGTSGDSRKALSDVFWALLNSAEFVLNH